MLLFSSTQQRQLASINNLLQKSVLVDGAVPPHRACEKHGLDFRYERYGNRNSVKRVFREVKRRTTLKLLSNAEAETGDEWLRSFAFAWNQLI